LPLPGRGPGQGPWHDGSATQTAIRICRDAVTGRMSREGYRSINIESSVPHPRPAGYGWIEGLVTGRRGVETARFGFSCTANFGTGSIVSVDLRRR
jgi:hypothetical protein